MKYIVTLNGKNYEVDVTETEAVVTGVKEVSTAPVAAPAGAPAAVPAAAPAAPAVAAPTDGTPVKAPMPGTILSIKAPVGTAVKAGDVVLVLEAMKMENDIVAPCDGTVKQVLVAKGASVNTDDVLAVI
ncbi:MAG: biotin/lipoyl-containing protein [Oscillospiraceae bacterium]|nr:biotin/lipoyl-containing protein [Oscillospiraceae bacterium]